MLAAVDTSKWTKEDKTMISLNDSYFFFIMASRKVAVSSIRWWWWWCTVYFISMMFINFFCEVKRICLIVWHSWQRIKIGEDRFTNCNCIFSLTSLLSLDSPLVPWHPDRGRKLFISSRQIYCNFILSKGQKSFFAASKFANLKKKLQLIKTK